MAIDPYAHVPARREIIDRRALADVLDTHAEGDDPVIMRTRCLGVLKEAYEGGRAVLVRRLDAGGHGSAICGGHSFLIDQIVRLAYDFITRHVHPPKDSPAERLTLLAVGGYGRAELAPYSDIDIHFITPQQPTPWIEKCIESLLYILWDLKLKVGQAVRTLADTMRMAREDMSVRTALLESRYLWGDKSLYDEARTLFRKDIVATSAQAFIEAKLAERDARHKRMGDSRYVVEPNLKDGKGGLRDLHTLFWIGKYLHNVDDPAQLVDKGLLREEEYRSFARAANFLSTVRCHLHNLSGRAEDRLTFDVQPELARRMKYVARHDQSGVERFMKHYFLNAKQVGDLTRVFLAHLSEQTKRKPLFRLPNIARRRSRLDGFIVDGRRLSINDIRIFRQSPVRLLKLFALADQMGLEIHPLAMRQATRDAPLITAAVRNDPLANQLFLDILTSTKNSEIVLRWMNEAGIFGRFVPDFGRVVAQMQYDMYHHYTVDEHTIRAIGLLAAIERGDLKNEHPDAHAMMQKLVSRRVLYVAVLLHDIAKGRRGDHSILGAGVAEKLCPRLGFTPAETETVAWLVRYHLLMSDTAFKRDLTDMKTIIDFVERVQSPERLRLLFALTTVDIRAVGPGIWNNWKGQLLLELYRAAEEVLIAGHKETGRAARIESQQALLRTQLDWPEAIFESYSKRFFDSYWIAEPLDVLKRNAESILAADAAGETFSVRITEGTTSTAAQISIYGIDHPGLFSRLSGALALAGANILGAKIHTTRDGMALDNFVIEDASGVGFGEARRRERLAECVRDVTSGKIKLADSLGSRNLPARRAAFKIVPVVLVDTKASNRYTVIEVNALDRPALLYALTRTMFLARITIHSAYIATYGERAVGVYYITDLTNEKITNTNRLKALERRLLLAAGDQQLSTTRTSEAA